ncbi:MAG: HNH endonuclease [Acidimicrobiales bacterium]
MEGRSTTARRVVWELERGPVPAGAKVLACPAEPGCVRVGHLRLAVRDESRPVTVPGR